MEQDVETIQRRICNTCLSLDRDIIILNEQSDLFQMFRLLTYDFAGEFDTLNGQTLEVCWECVAMLRKFTKFRTKVQTAQQHLRVISDTQENMDHTYLSQSLSSMEMILKLGYDKIYIDTTPKLLTEWSPHYIEISTSENIKNEQYDIAQVVRENINLELDDNILTVPSVVIDGQTVPHIMINAEPLATETGYKESNNLIIPELTVSSLEIPNLNVNIEKIQKDITEEKPDLKAGYTTEYMNEEDMLAFREEAKKKFAYASAIHKCELCIIGFYTQQQVEEHYEGAHKAREGTAPCKVCYSYVEEGRVSQHMQGHYVRHVCRLCGHAEATVRCAQLHVQTHHEKKLPSSLIKIGDIKQVEKLRQKKKKKDTTTTTSDPKGLRKLLSKTTIVGYQCLECDMFFKNSRARKAHVARYHREGLQCDHCKKRFVNRTTLVTHLKLHEGPPPREQCPICSKLVRTVQLKYHIQRHQNKGRYECTDCNKVFSYLTTYQGHLKYSRAHASEQVLKFPCPMCNKGYPTKEAMQDHFNYQHLGKTSHKCPLCDKPIASRANVERHLMRVHGEKKEKPKNHVCQQCGKAFTDKKSLNQHEVIHSGDRPLSCNICYQTFKQKASLYTHRKRVHNITPAKRVVEFIDNDKTKVDVKTN
ncbi:PREDICTED: gastrula zinc finger protein xFG20-1-like isoform X2 [Papilio xuthus]|uniref:Gastrula zinc finger protein xFG20-1-like isoform X2 n=1 Tax=Papilio xuthus TaxID=66420 RepID=A0AAJ7E5J4_PAPXU|nr:PREDICTED: gastrula zinc finger protein xFG20-1-like isoform X2 [Papilio xuthus]